MNVTRYLVGLSYGSSIISGVGVGDAAPDRIRALVCLDVLVPEDRDSSWSMANDEEYAWYVSGSALLPTSMRRDSADPLVSEARAPELEAHEDQVILSVMKEQSSAISDVNTSLSGRSGLWWGLLGVVAFSFTVPLTRVAVEGGDMSPLFVGAGRAVIAAVLAGAALWFTHQKMPRGRQWLRVAIVAGGAVVGFPLLTSYALTVAAASHGAVVIALLPAATAVMAVLRTGQRPGRPFWIAACLGAVAAITFAAIQGGGLVRMHWSGLLLCAAVIVCAIGYAEGGLLSRELGSWQTISWGLVLASPLMVVLTGVAVIHQPPTGTVVEWGAFAYLAAVSAFLGFFAWYRGLAIGPMAQVSQVQLAQPVMTICWAAMLLGEQLTWATILGGVAVIGCALLAMRSRNQNKAPATSPAATTATQETTR